MSSPHLSRREVEDLRSSIDKVIYKCLGYSDSSILSTASSCLSNGYDRRKTADKLATIIDSKKAARLAEKILQLGDEAIAAQKPSSAKKRSHDNGDNHRESKKNKPNSENSKTSKDKSVSNGSTDVKSTKHDNNETPEEQTTVLSADRVRMMMVNAQKEIEERKKSLNALKKDDIIGVNSNIAAVNAAKAAAAHIKNQINHTPGAPMPPPGIIKPVLYSQPSKFQNIVKTRFNKLIEA